MVPGEGQGPYTAGRKNYSFFSCDCSGIGILYFERMRIGLSVISTARRNLKIPHVVFGMTEVRIQTVRSISVEAHFGMGSPCCSIRRASWGVCPPGEGNKFFLSLNMPLLTYFALPGVALFGFESVSLSKQQGSAFKFGGVIWKGYKSF